MRVALGTSMLCPALLMLLPAVGISKIRLEDHGRILSDLEEKTFLDAARCTCNATLGIEFDVSSSGNAGSLAVVVGKRCIDSETRLSDDCAVVWKGALSGLRQVQFELGVKELVACDASSTDSLIVVVDPNDEDLWQQIGTLELPADPEPPAPPEHARAIAGEGLAEIVFEQAKGKDKLEYQVLCEREGEPVFASPPEANFVSTQDLCGEGSAIVAREFVCAESGGTDSVTIQGLENGQAYRFYVVSIDAFGNPSAPTDAGSITPAPELDLWEVYKKRGGAADGGHCYVATAAFGDYDHPQVVALRAFRDRVLETSETGRGLIAFYYRHSPPLADWIRTSPARRKAAQLALWPLALLARGMLP